MNILKAYFLLIAIASYANAFTLSPFALCKNKPIRITANDDLCSSKTALKMGLFDGFKKAFANEEYATPPEGIKATARHILVKNTEEVDEIMAKLGEGSFSFASLASQYSTCPSGSSGGSLGSFSPGTMVPEFDSVIFDPNTNLGEVVGPVQTKFGYHLIVVDKRTGV